MAAIIGTQWRGKIRVPKVFNSSIQAETHSDVSSLPRIFVSRRDESVIPDSPLCLSTLPSLSLIAVSPLFLPSLSPHLSQQSSPKTWQACPYGSLLFFFFLETARMGCSFLVPPGSSTKNIEITNNQQETVSPSCSL